MPDYFRATPPITLMTSVSGRVFRKRVRMVDADHYSWEEVYDLLGVEPDLESSTVCDY